MCLFYFKNIFSYIFWALSLLQKLRNIARGQRKQQKVVQDQGGDGGDIWIVFDLVALSLSSQVDVALCK